MVVTRIGTFPLGSPIEVTSSYRGALSGFSYTMQGVPNAGYIVGLSHDGGNNALGSMRVNGSLIFDSYSAGNGTNRVTSGWSEVVTGNGGLLSWEGFGTQTVRANFKLFAVRIS